ncbi:MAG: methyl-accepting chemotaxis protein [Bdellovibrionota bacterium]|nr:methyl-accepting chemotaxis protein [Bdellovibrionota bacterium]
MSKLEVEHNVDSVNFEQMIEKSPINTMFATPEGVLTYMNARSKSTLKTLEQYLPDRVENLIGQSIDWFHKDPAVQRRIIADPSNLPHKAIIDVGPEKLDLLVSPILNSKGEYLGPMVTWSVVTEQLKVENEMARMMQMVERSPINTMMAKPDGTLIYLNDNAKKTLKTLEQYLPDRVENLINHSIDWFHKDPEVQRRIISDPSNLPHRAVIDVGPEKLDLLVSPILNNSGDYLGPMVTWSVVTEKLRNETEMARMMQMVEKSTINTMMAKPDGTLIYLNESAKRTLKTLEQYLPDRVENLEGRSIDIFHKDPEVQRRIISDSRNLPHTAKIDLGPEKLRLDISAINDQNGNYLGPMVTWSVITDRFTLVDILNQSSSDLADSASSLITVSSSLTASAEETAAQANTASTASEEINAGVQTVASNMEEMVAAIKEITQTTNEASAMSNDAMKMAKSTNEIIGQLGESSMDIGNVIKVISSIAQQTNLLALNATIEAARAGEAGKGFAVVANEVKELAKQTAKATADITKKIEAIQADSKNAVSAIGEISDAIEKVNGYAGNIAASVEEQAATTNEVTRIVTEAAEGVKQINENITQVSEAAANTGKDAANAQDSSRKLEEIAEKLRGHIEKIEL